MTPALYIVEIIKEVINMLHNIRVSFRINKNLWKISCEISEVYEINKSDYLRSKIIEILYIFIFQSWDTYKE